MKDVLLSRLKVDEESIHVLYDRPGEVFSPTTLSQQHKLFYAHRDEFARPLRDLPLQISSRLLDLPEDEFEYTLFTRKSLAFRRRAPTTPPSPSPAREDLEIQSEIELRRDRPCLIVTSTSYTPDEDLSLLLRSIVAFDKRVAEVRGFACFLFVITGKGPLRPFFERMIDELRDPLLRSVVLPLFLPTAEYPVLLGCADLSISLHTSSSGVDLPMKVLDFLGSGVPVLAFDYPTLRTELIEDGRNGLLFHSEEDLTANLWKLLHNFGSLDGGVSSLERMKRRVVLEYAHNTAFRWEENWKSAAFRVFHRLTKEPSESAH